MPLEKSAALRNAKTGVGRRAIKEREAKIIENPKKLLVMKGHRASMVVINVLSNLHLLKKPLTRKLNRKNECLPFETGGDTHLENLCRLNDCSLFAVGNHTKKRPHNLILGRTHDFRILDMLEFGITEYQQVFKPISGAPGTAALVLFNGDDWEANEATTTARSLLSDIFRAPSDIDRLALAGVDRAVVFTLEGDKKIKFRHYQIKLKRAANSRLPRPELEEVGPAFDLTFRRTHIAPENLMKEAMRQAKDPRIDWVTKNVTKNAMGDKEGRIHLGKQDLSGLATARMKALQKRKRARKDITDEGAEAETKKVRFE